MRHRYTLTYKTRYGYIALTNLSEYAGQQIKQAQEHLGSTDIRLQRQGHWYGDILTLVLHRQETDLLTEGDINVLRRYVEEH